MAMGSDPAIAQKEPVYKNYPLSAWVKDLTSVARLDRERAAAAIGAIGPEAGKAVQPLLAAYQKEREAELRVAYLDALGKIGRNASPAVPTLLEWHDAATTGFFERPRIFQTLLKIDADWAVSHRLEWVIHIKDVAEFHKQREELAKHMSPIPPEYAKTRKVLDQLADSPKGDVRVRTAILLLRVDPALARHDKAFARILDRALQEKEQATLPPILDELRLSKVRLRDHPKIAKDLRSALNHPAAMTRIKAADVLVSRDPRIGDDKETTAQMVGLAKELLTSKSREVQVGAGGIVVALSDNGFDKPLVPILKSVLDHPDGHTRLNALRTLIRVAPRAGIEKEATEHAGKVIADLFTSKDLDVVREAMATITEISDSEVRKSLVPGLKQLAEKGPLSLRDSAKRWLWEAENLPVMPALAYLPFEPRTISQIEIKRLIDLLKLKERRLAGELRKIEEFLAAEGLKVNLFTDVATITFASPVAEGPASDLRKGCLVLRGNFPNATPGKVFKSELFAQKYCGVCLDNRTLLITSEEQEAVLMELARLRPQRPNKLAPELQKVLAGVDTRAPLWFANDNSDTFSFEVKKDKGLFIITLGSPDEDAAKGVLKAFEEFGKGILTEIAKKNDLDPEKDFQMNGKVDGTMFLGRVEMSMAMVQAIVNQVSPRDAKP